MTKRSSESKRQPRSRRLQCETLETRMPLATFAGAAGEVFLRVDRGETPWSRPVERPEGEAIDFRTIDFRRVDLSTIKFTAFDLAKVDFAAMNLSAAEYSRVAEQVDLSEVFRMQGRAEAVPQTPRMVEQRGFVFGTTRGQEQAPSWTEWVDVPGEPESPGEPPPGHQNPDPIGKPPGPRPPQGGLGSILAYAQLSAQLQAALERSSLGGDDEDSLLSSQRGNESAPDDDVLRNKELSDEQEKSQAITEQNSNARADHDAADDELKLAQQRASEENLEAAAKRRRGNDNQAAEDARLARAEAERAAQLRNANRAERTSLPLFEGGLIELASHASDGAELATARDRATVQVANHLPLEGSWWDTLTAQWTTSDESPRDASDDSFTAAVSAIFSQLGAVADAETRGMIAAASTLAVGMVSYYGWQHRQRKTDEELWLEDDSRSRR